MHTTTASGQRTLPWSWYSDPQIAALEHERIFRVAWQYAGHLGELDGDASMFPTLVGGVPVVVCRTRDGDLRGFVNVCRHRGAVLVSEPQRRGTIQCPYHAWTYGLDGGLRGVPRAGEGFDREGLGLVPVAVGTWGPFVFVNLDPGAEPLAAALGDLPELVREHGLDVDALRFHSRARYDIRANWKVAIENYLECYHCQLNHPGLVQIIDERRLTLAAEGLRASMFGPPDAAFLEGRAPLAARGSLGECQNHLLLPAMKFNVLPGHPNLSIGPVWPTAPDRCSGFLDYFFGPDADEEWIADLLALDEQVGVEDTGLVEAVQTGMAGGVLEDGPLMGDAEQLIAFFQDYVRERVGP